VTALLVGSVVLLGTDGCGFPDVPASAAAPTTEAPVHTAWRHRVAEPVVEPGRFGDEPAAEFGRAGVKAAYAETVRFAADTTFDEMLLVPTPYRGKAQFLRHVSRMSMDMATDYGAMVDAAWDGDTAAADELFACRFYFDDDPAYRLQATGPLVLDHVIEDPQMYVERGTGVAQPEVSFVQRGDVRMQVDGEDVLVRYIKTATYWLVPAPPGDAFRWRIDGYYIDWDTADPVPDTGTY
jgi:hypothetical protein